MGKEILTLPRPHAVASFVNNGLVYGVYIVFLGLLLAFSDIMGLLPIPIAGIKFYGADFLVVLIILIILSRGLLSITNMIIALLLLTFLFYGIFSMLYGYAAGHELREIFGDFRRLFFYSLAFGITWRVLDRPRRLHAVERIIYVAVIPVIVISALRAWSGVSWTPIHSEADLRAVSYVSGAILFWVFYDGVARLALTSKGKTGERVGTVLLLIMVSFTFLIANYRLFWVIPLIGSIILFTILWQTGILRSMALLRVVLFIGAAAVLAILLLNAIQNQLYSLVERKFVEDVLGFQFKDSFRYFVWGEAWHRFSGNWLFGVGIGDVLEYSIINSQGNWQLGRSTAHNILVEIGYQTGIVGLILFSLPHTFFVYYIWRNLSRINTEWARPALVLLTTYFSMFFLGVFQPFLTEPSVAVLFYTVMGVAARYIYWGRRNNLEIGRADETGLV